MSHSEAIKAFLSLASYYPNQTLPNVTQDNYVRRLVKWDTVTTARAIEAVTERSPFFPSWADLHEAYNTVMRDEARYGRYDPDLPALPSRNEQAVYAELQRRLTDSQPMGADDKAAGDCQSQQTYACLECKDAGFVVYRSTPVRSMAALHPCRCRRVSRAT
ncbi:MAG: hypothetical protein M3Q29_01145 [Chloroflexota bacterium]|nr:hypothetical protein [Chloroflexota bacterium]